MAKQYVMTDYDGCDYITAGKVYEMTLGEDTDELIRPDIGCAEINIIGPGYHVPCAHLHGIDHWYYVDAEGNKL